MESIDEQGKLLNPLSYYKEELAEKFLAKLKNNFENLLKESNIDIEANREAVKEYNEILNNKENNKNTLKWLKIFSFLLILIIIYLILMEIDSIQKLRYLFEQKQSIEKIALKVFGIGIGILLFLILNFNYLRKKKNSLIEMINHLEKVLKEKEEECYSQVRPLLNLFDDNMANKMITDIIPTLVLDKDFKIERYANLVKNFGMLPRLNEKYSAKDVISGEILGNPFIITKSSLNRVIDHEYSGSLTVSWKEYYIENGKKKSRTVSETLRASIIKPKQIFEDIIYLTYGNDAAEHLTFSREPQYIHNLTPKKIEKHVKKVEKEIHKKSETSIKKGGTFLEMGNLEFDALFKALNRDNEVEFRVLFTPIAQKNMIDLIKDKDFGDDFSYYKNLKLNTVSNNRDWMLNIDRKYYINFDYDKIVEKYYDINKKYFNNFYKLFLPILSIPVYHQHKSIDYIYNEDFNYNYNPYTAEIMANILGDNIFAHPERTTPSILKTNTILTIDDIDLVEVTANSYKEVKRTDYIPKCARNGKIYNVPVEWIDYIPLTSSGKMELRRVNMGEKEFDETIDSEFLENTKNRKFAYKNNIFAIYTNKNKITCDKILEKIIKKFK